MVKFIQKYCDSKKISILRCRFPELHHWDFSGDSENDGRQETWKRLLLKLDKISELNKLDNTNKP